MVLKPLNKSNRRLLYVRPSVNRPFARCCDPIQNVRLPGVSAANTPGNTDGFFSSGLLRQDHY